MTDRDEILTTSVQNLSEQPPGEQKEDSLLLLAIVSLFVGVLAGLVGTGFRLSLLQANLLRKVFTAWAQGQGLVGLSLEAAACAAAAATAAWLVRRFSPFAAGSGIPHAEAVLAGDIPQAPIRLIPVKFFGGILAIGAGLALGREGPSVQMGANLAHLAGRISRRGEKDCRTLLAAGAGAGLATAFNAPLAGAIFVLEELVRRFETRIAIAALGASATAIAVSRAFLGSAPDLPVASFPDPQMATLPLYFGLGVLAGLATILYNTTVLGTCAAMDRMERLTVEVRAGLVGVAVGVIAWLAPELVGGGEFLTEQCLNGRGTVPALVLMFLFRLILGAVSYGARTPGGLFAPMLVLGSQLGLAFGLVCQMTFPNLAIQPAAFALVGMAAFLTGVVRSPITGLILIVEMTGSSILLVPLLSACFTAMLVPTLACNPPIYETLRERIIRSLRRQMGV